MTTGEWAGTCKVFGEYRAPTGVSGVGLSGRRRRGLDGSEANLQVEALATALGRRPRILVGKPGLDGHSNGAEQIAVRRATPVWRSCTKASG